MADLSDQQKLRARLCDPNVTFADLSDMERRDARHLWQRRNVFTRFSDDAGYPILPLLVIHFLLFRYLHVSFWWMLVSGAVVYGGLFIWEAVCSEREEFREIDFKELQGQEQKQAKLEAGTLEATQKRERRKAVLLPVCLISLVAVGLAALLTAPDRPGQEAALRSELSEDLLHPGDKGLVGNLAAQYVRGKIESSSVSFIDLLHLHYSNYWVCSVLTDRDGKFVSVGAFKQVHFFHTSSESAGAK